MGNLLEALGVNFKMVLIQAVGFIFLLLLLRKFLFGKIKDMIKARSDEIKDTYKKSEDYRSEAERLKGEYQRRVIQAEEEAEGKIQIIMFIGLGFIEALAIYSLVLSFILMGRLPETAEVLKILSAH